MSFREPAEGYKTPGAISKRKGQKKALKNDSGALIEGFFDFSRRQKQFHPISTNHIYQTSGKAMLVNVSSSLALWPLSIAARDWNIFFCSASVL